MSDEGIPTAPPGVNVPVAADGATAITEGWSRPGDHVDLRAETDVLVAVSNCPQTRNPCNGGRPTPIRLVTYVPQDPVTPSGSRPSP